MPAAKTTHPTRPGMVRDADYWAAVQAAITDAPPLDAQQKSTLRAILAATPATAEPRRPEVAA